MELKITKEKVLEAASKCSTAKDILTTMFPEVFQDGGKYFNLRKSEMDRGDNIYENGPVRIALGFGCAPDELRDKCFYLDDKCAWEIKNDKYGAPCLLIPTKKQ